VIAEIRSLTSKPFAMSLWVSMEDEGARTSDENRFSRESLAPLLSISQPWSAAYQSKTLFVDTIWSIRFASCWTRR